jgi:hypothetical protein
MMWALAKHRDESPSPAAIDSARAGLAAIFAFMLVVALQPLLFECTGRILDWTNLGYFVYSQGIERSVSPELYAPLVIVVAILVGPILRTVDGGEPRFRRTKRIAVAILSLIIVGIGCTALSLAQYVAGASGLLISEMMPELAAGNDLIAWQKVLAIGGIVLLWTMVGLCTFWLPVYWITSAIVSGGRVLWPALLAGVAVCLIPLFTIGSDAFTFAAAFPLAVLSSRRFNFQDELGGWAETLTGVIPTIIVVVVVVLVLRAFRAIAEHMLSTKPPGSI